MYVIISNYYSCCLCGTTESFYFRRRRRSRSRSPLRRNNSRYNSYSRSRSRSYSSDRSYRSSSYRRNRSRRRRHRSRCVCYRFSSKCLRINCTNKEAIVTVISLHSQCFNHKSKYMPHRLNNNKFIIIKSMICPQKKMCCLFVGSLKMVLVHRFATSLKVFSLRFCYLAWRIKCVLSMVLTLL